MYVFDLVPVVKNVSYIVVGEKSDFVIVDTSLRCLVARGHVSEDLCPVPPLVVEQTLSHPLHLLPDAADISEEGAQDHVVQCVYRCREREVGPKFLV